MTSKVVVGVASGFVVSYGVWQFQRMMVSQIYMQRVAKQPAWRVDDLHD